MGERNRGLGGGRFSVPVAWPNRLGFGPLVVSGPGRRRLRSGGGGGGGQPCRRGSARAVSAARPKDGGERWWSGRRGWRVWRCWRARPRRVSAPPGWATALADRHRLRWRPRTGRGGALRLPGSSRVLAAGAKGGRGARLAPRRARAGATGGGPAGVWGRRARGGGRPSPPARAPLTSCARPGPDNRTARPAWPGAAAPSRAGARRTGPGRPAGRRRRPAALARRARSPPAQGDGGALAAVDLPPGRELRAGAREPAPLPPALGARAVVPRHHAHGLRPQARLQGARPFPAALRQDA